MSFIKYQIQIRQVSYDNGNTWRNMEGVYRIGSILENPSTCGDVIEYRWVQLPITEDYDCDTSTHTKYQIAVKQQRVNGGAWEDVVPKETMRSGTTIPYSEDCGYTALTREVSGTPYCSTDYVTLTVIGASGDWTRNGNTFTSNQISHSETTVETIYYEVNSSCNLTFDITQSSEKGFDYLIVGKIDDEVENSTDSTHNAFNAKGFTGTTSTTLSTSEGTHSIQLMYRKDGSVSQGSDNVIVTLGVDNTIVKDKLIDVSIQESYDNGQTWVTQSTETRIYEHNSEDCGYEPTYEYRWALIPITEDYDCDTTTHTKYQIAVKYQRVDGGAWTQVVPKETIRSGQTIANSEDCGYEPSIEYRWYQYPIDEKWDCDEGSIVTTNLGTDTFYGGVIPSSRYSGIAIEWAIIGDGITSIGDGAFANCTSLSSVTYNGNVYTCKEDLEDALENNGVDIGANAFNNTNLVCPEPQSPVIVLTLSNGETKTLYTSTPTSSISQNYRSTLISAKFNNLVTSIDYGAFSACTSLTSINLGNGLTSIGGDAFYGCTSLTSITIPNSVTSITNCAFQNCTSLASITIPNSVTSIQGGLFRSCTSLSSVTIPNSVTSIGQSAFNGCSGLTSVTIPNSVTSIGQSAFNGCSGLTSVTIPNSVTTIESWAFEYCSSLTSVTIPNSVTSIGSMAFAYCSSLTTITMPNSVTSIGHSAFSNCSGITTITMPNSVTSIGHSAFSNCTSLTNVEISSGVTSIDNWVFINCSSLTSVIIHNSVTSIGSSAFSNCTSLTDISYNSTTSNWINISKGSSWHYNVPSTCFIHCTDGDISIGDS